MFFDHYPYTNFHNVNLDWVLQAVKSWGAMVEANNQGFIDLKAANASFKTYVTTYLQNLDVSDEINDKLDQMLASGVLTPYFAPYVKGYVESWLASNVSPTSPALDKTLTLDDAAANSAATGERITRAAFLRTLDDPELYKIINKNFVLPGYRIQSACHALGYFFVCGGSETEDGNGFIAKMSNLDFSDAVITYIQGLGHANDITYSYSDNYLYITTVGEGVDWGIVKINPNDFTDRTLITNCPANTIGIQYISGWTYILAPYRIYRTNNFNSYELVVENTNDILNKFGIPQEGRISQTLVRVQDDVLGWVGTYIREPEHVWHGFIVYFGSHGAITFELFPTYNTECQAGVWDGKNTVYFICNGTTSHTYTVLKADVTNPKFHMLRSGNNLNDFTGEGIYYLLGAANMDNCPVTDEGLTLLVDPQGLLNTRQDIYTNSGRHLYRIKLFNPGTWGEWIEPASEVTQIKEDLSAIFNDKIGSILLSEYTDKRTLKNGAIDGTGAVATLDFYVDNSRYFDYMDLDINATYVKAVVAQRTSPTNFYVYVNFYDADKNFLSRSGGGGRPYITIADIPANSKYIRVTFTQITDSTLGDDNIVNVGVTQYSRKGIYSGKKLYIVGDSISAGYVSMFKSDAEEKGLYIQYTAPVENEGQVVCSVWDRSGTLSYWGQANDNIWGMDITNLSAPGKGYLRVSSTDRKSGVEVIRDTSFEDADVIIIALGFNDWHYEITRGNHDLIDANVPYPTEGYDTTLLTTYNQAIWYSIGEILRKAPNARLVVQTPMNGWAYGGDFSTNWGIGYSLENSGTLADVHDDIVYWCNYYGVQYLDMTYNNSVVNRVNIKKTIIDGSHPSEAAHRALGLYVSGLL